MEKVVDLKHHLEDKKLRRQIEIHRNKSEIVQRIVQCALCQFRCAMCGRHVKETESDCNLCPSCYAEYEDFQSISKGKQGAGVFWQNRQWLNLWAAWLDYRKAIGEFRNSDEYRRLTEELKE
jgi:hypothetical protein